MGKHSQQDKAYEYLGHLVHRSVCEQCWCYLQVGSSLSPGKCLLQGPYRGQEERLSLGPSLQLHPVFSSLLAPWAYSVPQTGTSFVWGLFFLRSFLCGATELLRTLSHQEAGSQGGVAGRRKEWRQGTRKGSQCQPWPSHCLID